MEIVNTECEECVYEDIDIHRYKCKECGEVKYYSSAARAYYEQGVESNVKGLNNEFNYSLEDMKVALESRWTIVDEKYINNLKS
jgi:hypothetical protein